jgi:hypothetical protein
MRREETGNNNMSWTEITNTTLHLRMLDLEYQLEGERGSRTPTTEHIRNYLHIPFIGGILLS